MKKYFNIFIYVSLIFLIIALYKLNFLSIPKIFNYYSFSLSIVFLLAGFMADSLSWYKILKSKGYIITFSQSLTSMGLSVFGKYIPGKLWVVLGRSAYIAKITGENEKELGVISLIAQFLSLLAGAVCGVLVFVVLPFDKSYPFIILTIIVIALFIFIIFFKYIHNLVDYLIKRFFKSSFIIPRISFNESAKLIHWYILPWLFWSLGFYMLINSFTDEIISVLTGFSFPLACSVGLVAVFIPGGLGVRESIITGILVLFGLPLSNSTTISVVGRLWFVIGELSIFLYSIIFSYISRKKQFS